MGMFGGIGSAIGGAVGTIGSILGGTSGYKPSQIAINKQDYVNPEQAANQKMLADMLAQYQGRTATQDPYAAMQMAQAQALQQQAAGQGPSLAQSQLQQGTNRNLAQQMALMASARSNPAMAMRMSAMNAANIGQQSAQQAADLRLQEQLGAQGLLGQALQTGRGQNLSTQQANDAAVQQAMQQYLANQQQQIANMNLYYGMATGQNNAYNTAAAAGQQSGISNLTGLLGGIGGAIMPLATSWLKPTGAASGTQMTGGGTNSTMRMA